MSLTRAAFALPGDITTVTGGYLYDRRLFEGLAGLGHAMRLVPLSPQFPFADEAAMAESLATLAELPADCPVIVDGLAYGAMATEGLARARAPIVALVHHPLALESGLPADQAAHLEATECANLRLARHVLVPSPHTRRILFERYDVPPEKITIARPGINPVRIAPAPTDPPLILSVGILHPRKGHDILIAALGDLGDLNWRAVIAGTPWEAGHADALARQIAASPVADRITLAGSVSDARLEALYAEASLFALATRYEGHGLVFDEAILRGLPILSCRTGAVPDTVPQDAGLLVAPDDATAFAGALRLMLTDHARREGAALAARRAAAMLPDWPATARVASGVLQGLV